MKLKHYLILASGSAVITWFMWSHAGRHYTPPRPETALDVIETVELDTPCSRNVVAIQPHMKPEDYRSEDHFYEKLNAYFSVALNAGLFRKNTTVLLPEYLGVWLVIAGEKRLVSETSDLNTGMTVMALTNFFSFLRHWFLFNPENQNEAVLFRMKASQMAHIYSSVFRKLAKKYRITIVAGSIILPDPAVFRNEITLHLTGELLNCAFIFYPDGSIDPRIVKKSFPVADEQKFMAACPVSDLPVFDLGIGKTVVMICADSWYPETYAEAERKNAQIILVPSYAQGNGKMQQPWEGYDGYHPPDDVDRNHVLSISESEAWKKYALPGRFPKNAVLGVNVFLRGDFWNLGSDGRTLIVYKENLIEVQQSERAGIWNICF